MLNFRVSEEESAILAEYASESGQSMTDVVRAFIRSLEGKLRRVSPATITPELLPSLPLSKRAMNPPVSAVYFILTESGEVLYIGQTENLATRHCAHQHRKEALAIDAHARLHWLEKRAERVSFERACIAQFKPRLNRPRGH